MWERNSEDSSKLADDEPALMCGWGSLLDSPTADASTTGPGVAAAVARWFEGRGEGEDDVPCCDFM